MQRRGNAGVDAGMRFGEVAEPVHQPLGGEVRRGADGKNARALPLQKPLGAYGDAVQCIAYDVEIVPARFRDDEALSFAIEKLDGKFGFECLDLVAYRSLGDAKFFCGAGEALMPSRGLEGFQGIQRWQARAHRTLSRQSMRKIRAGQRNDALRAEPNRAYRNGQRLQIM
jgi:hypothetical protein